MFEKCGFAGLPRAGDCNRRKVAANVPESFLQTSVDVHAAILTYEGKIVISCHDFRKNCISLHIPHTITIVQYIVPLRVGGDTMIHTGDIPAKIYESLEPFYLQVDCGSIFGKNTFVHATDTA